MGQNLKQTPENFLKTFNVEEVALTSHLMKTYREINIASEKIINYRVTSPSNHHCCQINIIVRERPGILVIIHFSHLNQCVVMHVFCHYCINALI